MVQTDILITFSDLRGKRETLLCQILQAVCWGLRLGNFGNGLIFIRGTTLQECTNNLTVFDPVASKLVRWGSRITVSKDYSISNIVTIELPWQIKGTGVEVWQVVIFINWLPLFTSKNCLLQLIKRKRVNAVLVFYHNKVIWQSIEIWNMIIDTVYIRHYWEEA